jgi:putative hydrolase of the HAD superfamily
MSPERRAVIFDLDDTLYPYRRFVVSGFAAVASDLASRCGLDARRVFTQLVRDARGTGRGVELQRCLAAFGLPDAELSGLIDRLRAHTPRLRLSRDARRTLDLLRQRRWRIGLLTNGPRDIQTRKITALGLERDLDAVVFAPEAGSGAGKPEREAFLDIVRRLDVRLDASVFVGDDERCDVLGALAAGIHAVRCAVWRPVEGPSAAAVVIDRLAQVPQVAHALVTGEVSRYVA